MKHYTNSQADTVCSFKICMPLRAALPPLQTAQSFACSVASLSRFPCHQLPGRRSLRCGALADCLLGQDSPSTRIAGLSEVPDTTSPSPRSGDRRALPLPAANFISFVAVWPGLPRDVSTRWQNGKPIITELECVNNMNSPGSTHARRFPAWLYTHSARLGN